MCVLLTFKKIKITLYEDIHRVFYIFSPNCSTQMNVSLPFECHNVAYQCKGIDQSNIVCEYEVNMSTNETEKQNFNTNC